MDPKIISPARTMPCLSGRPKRAEGPMSRLVAAVRASETIMRGLLFRSLGIKRLRRVVTKEVAIIANK